MNTQTRSKRRSALRSILVGSVAIIAVAGLTSVPAQAVAPGPWIAMVYSATEGVLGGGTGETQDAAIASAMVGCRDMNLGTDCQTIGVADADAGIPCLAVARGTDPAQWGVGSGTTIAGAEADALNTLPGGQIYGSGCAEPSAAAPTGGTATVTNDVDVYEVPDGIGSPYPGVFLNAGDSFALVEPCRDNWCHLVTPGIGDGTSWVYQDGFLDVS